jgi:hypothetical protein
VWLRELIASGAAKSAARPAQLAEPFQLRQRSRGGIFVNGPEASGLLDIHGKIRHLLEISPDARTGFICAATVIHTRRQFLID